MEPFPAVTEEDMSAVQTREGGAAEGIFETPKYDSKEMEAGIIHESKRSSEMAEKEGIAEQRPPLERHVRSRRRGCNSNG